MGVGMECRLFRLRRIDCRLGRRASSRWVLGLLILVSFSAAPNARGNIIITLAAADADGNAVADPVPAGTKVFVDISLSVDDADNPLLDVRSIQFDF